LQEPLLSANLGENLKILRIAYNGKNLTPLFHFYFEIKHNEDISILSILTKYVF
jgi:hypothetical protein